MRAAATIGAALFGTALAAWLAPASVHMVTWSEQGPERVAVFAPLSRLLWSAAIAAAAAALLWLMPPRTAHARARRATAIAPLLGLFLCAVPYLPWLPDRVPVLLVLAGPCKWVVIAGVVLASGWRFAGASRQAPRWLVAPDRRLVFAVSLVVYLAFGLRSLATIGVKGDEPHYLIISQSLLADGDLQIENNHRAREYRSFTREELPPDYMQRGQNGEIYSIHAPGLPALLLPAYALAGKYGALLMLCASGALAALAVFDLAAVVAGPAVALITWAAVALTVPFVPYAWSIFPEMPGAAIVAWAAVWLASRRDVSRARWAMRGIVMALLPWLHTKFVIFQAALVMLLAWRLRRQRASALALLAPVVVSGIAWFGFFYVVYGSPNPEAPYGTYARDWVKVAYVPRGLLGLLFDQKFGLLIYAPVYVLAPAGLWMAWRLQRWRWNTWALAAVAAAFAVSSARLYMWWGGWSAPARFLVPATPLLVPAVALAVDYARRTAGAWIVYVLLAASLAIALVSAALPGRLLLFSDAHGVSRLADEIQGSAPLTATLPMFTESEWQMRDLLPRPYLPAERTATVARARIALLEAFDPERRRAFAYSTRRVLGPDQWREAGTLTADLAAPDQTPPLAASGIYAEGDSFWTMGTDRGRVLVAPRGRRTVEATVHIGPAGGICRTWVNGDVWAEPMQPNETRQLTFDRISAKAAWVAVTVQASHAFRPADVDPQSTDQRLLGCQVQLTLR
jgi:hypothetical protein